MVENRDELLRLLNQAMSNEYGALFMLPTYIAQVQDGELKRQLRVIEEMELDHAEKTAQLIYALGGVPNADLPKLRPRSGVREIVEAQLEAEKVAIDIYTRGVALAKDARMYGVLVQLRKDEEGHLAILQRALATLDGAPA